MATVKKSKKAQNGDTLVKKKETASGTKYKYASEDGNYSTKFKWSDGKSSPDKVVKRRTLKGLLSGAPKSETFKAKNIGQEKMVETPEAKDGKWIQKAIKKPGALRSSLGVKKGEKIPAGKLAAAAKKPGKLGQRARLAQTLKKMKKK